MRRHVTLIPEGRGFLNAVARTRTLVNHTLDRRKFMCIYNAVVRLLRRKIEGFFRGKFGFAVGASCRGIPRGQVSGSITRLSLGRHRRSLRTGVYCERAQKALRRPFK